MASIQKNDKHDYYDICRKFLTVSGQWPYQKPRERLLHMSILIIWNISILAAQIAQLCVCETTQCILQTIPMHMTALIVLVKLLTCHFNRQRIKYLLEQLHADWNILDTQEEWEIMKRYAMSGRWYALVYASYVYVCTFTFGPTALLPRILDVVSPLNESRPVVLPCPAYYFVDENKYFYYIFFHLEFGAIICIAGLIAHDCTFLTYVEHICGLFAIVGFRFEQVLYKRNITNKYLIDTSNNVYGKNIAFSIEAHRKALGFAALVEKAFSSSFAIQLLIIVIAMSSSLIQISTELHGDLAEVIRYFIFTVGQLLHLLVFSFQGQKLINHSLETHAKIYNGLWYEIPVKSQKLLVFAMRKSMQTVSVSAGKIYIFSLENFTTITQQEAGAIEMTRYVFYVMGQLFHLFCFSFKGQKLIDHSLGMRDKIYNSTWYVAPTKPRKLLIITMIQSLRPTFLSASKVYIFSLESSTTILQTSMSYFTILASFR